MSSFSSYIYFTNVVVARTRSPSRASRQRIIFLFLKFYLTPALSSKRGTQTRGTQELRRNFRIFHTILLHLFYSADSQKFSLFRFFAHFILKKLRFKQNHFFVVLLRFSLSFFLISMSPFSLHIFQIHLYFPGLTYVITPTSYIHRYMFTELPHIHTSL
jgi:hypothetical protein